MRAARSPNGLAISAGAPQVSVLVVDASAPFRDSLRAVIRQEPGLRLVAEADRGAAALDLFVRYRPDMVLLGVCLVDRSGLEVLKCIRRADAHCSLVLMGNRPDPFVEEVGRLMGATEVCQQRTDLAKIRKSLRRWAQERLAHGRGGQPAAVTTP